MPKDVQAIPLEVDEGLPESALVVPVPEAEPIVQDLRARFDPAAPAGVPAHITVLYPFLARDAITRTVVDELDAIFAGVPPFSFALQRVARFPDVVYLAPDPAEPFSRLTAAIATRWPGTPPYGGIYDGVIPHLTVAHTADPATQEEVRRRIEPALPVSCSARAAWLLISRRARWTVEQRFPFGGRENR